MNSEKKFTNKASLIQHIMEIEWTLNKDVITSVRELLKKSKKWISYHDVLMIYNLICLKKDFRINKPIRRSREKKQTLSKKVSK